MVQEERQGDEVIVESEGTEVIAAQSGDEVAQSDDADVTETEGAVTLDSEEKKGEWFIVQCYSGQEYRVRSRIQDLIDEKKFVKTLFRVLVPEEEIVEIKNNKRTERLTKIFPGYVFVQMDYDEATSFEIRKLPGVSKFVGSKIRPTPVQEAEILKVLRKVGDKTKKVDVDFEEGEVIKVIQGPFRGYTGPISEIQPDKGLLKTLISIFGRETPVELNFDQIEKVIK